LGYKTPSFRFREHSEKAGRFEATADRNPASALLVEKKKPGRYFGGERWLRLHLDRVAPGVPQRRSGLGLRRRAPTGRQIKIDSVP